MICRHSHKVKGDGTDLLVFSPPCQPFSEARHKGGKTSKTQSAEDHPQHNITVSDVPELVELLRPLTVIIEQVPGIEKPGKSGRSPLGVLLSELDKIYGIGCSAAVKLQSSIWIEGSRTRLPLGTVTLHIHHLGGVWMGVS